MIASEEIPTFRHISHNAAKSPGCPRIRSEAFVIIGIVAINTPRPTLPHFRQPTVRSKEKRPQHSRDPLTVGFLFTPMGERIQVLLWKLPKTRSIPNDNQMKYALV